MINVEETCDNTSAVASPDPFDLSSPKSDDGGSSPAQSSQYSSCGESEFERYCSANSVMETRSLCSSVGAFTDCMASEFFGSMKSDLGFGDDNGLENFSFEPNLNLSSARKDWLGNRRVEFLKDDNGDEGISCELSADMFHQNTESTGAQGVGYDGSYEGNLMGCDVDGGGSVPKLFVEERGGNILGSTAELEVGFGGVELGTEEDENLSVHEYSDDDGSMYGVDDEGEHNLYYPKKVPYPQDANASHENPFLINSSVAFGSEDWNDFELESGAGPLMPLILDKVQEREKQNPESERNSPEISTVSQLEGKDQTDVLIAGEQVQVAHHIDVNVNSVSAPTCFPIFGKPEQVGEVKDITIDSYQVKGADELVDDNKSSSIRTIGVRELYEPERDVRDISISSNKVWDVYDEMNFEKFSVSDICKKVHDQLEEKRPQAIGLKTTDFSTASKNLVMDTIATDDAQVLENQELGIFKVQFDPLADNEVHKVSPTSTEFSGKLNAQFSEEFKPKSMSSTFENMITSQKFPAPEDPFEVHPAPVKTGNLELNEFYDEFVHDMQEILLDSSVKSLGSRFPQGNPMFQSQPSLPLRDGGRTASTSGADNSYPQVLRQSRIDSIEVVGAKQKKGDVSLSERLVGVKEYAVYVIRVWSGKDKWEVERRYRDFFTLYRRLKSLFSDQGWILPSPWSSVERESRKIFGNASPNVIAERSVLIQECLQSVLRSRFFSSPPSALIWFLSPQDSCPSSPASNALVSQSTVFNRGIDTETISSLGKTISLIVEIQPHKSMKQLLEAQHYTCAGCHKHFDDGMTLMRDIVQTFGWGKPRLCVYTGQLFCSSCHTNDTAVLPAKVLHQWDFGQYSVSQLAKSYLDSIHDQPMLCASAVNPLLFSKVPALNHVMGIRKQIGTMLPYVRCPFRRSINKGLGSRRYLLENNDFFALKDLIDLSKGAFAVLPMMVENVSRRILEHITEQCLVCCDVGVACGARQACDDPSSLIFPFQVSTYTVDTKSSSSFILLSLQSRFLSFIESKLKTD